MRNITSRLEIGWLRIKSFFQWISEKEKNVFEGIQKLLPFDYKDASEAVSKKIVEDLLMSLHSVIDSAAG